MIVSSGAGQVRVIVDDVEEVLTVEASQLEDVLLNTDGLFAREAELVPAV